MCSQVRSPLFEKFIPDPFGLISYGEYIFFVRAQANRPMVASNFRLITLQEATSVSAAD